MIYLLLKTKVEPYTAVKSKVLSALRTEVFGGIATDAIGRRQAVEPWLDDAPQPTYGSEGWRSRPGGPVLFFFFQLHLYLYDIAL